MYSILVFAQVDIFMEAPHGGNGNAKRAARAEPQQHPNAAASASPLVSESAQWVPIGSAVTDTHGRLVFQMPEEHRRPLGIHRILMLVRYSHRSKAVGTTRCFELVPITFTSGRFNYSFSNAVFYRVDKSVVSLRLAVLRAGTPIVVFSVDGALMSSLSLTGHTAAVTPSAVDVVRFWEKLGYLVLYVTARPDMQHNSVARWLAKHRSLLLSPLLFSLGSSYCLQKC